MAAGDARRAELTRLVMAAQPTPFWLDRRDAPAPREPLRGQVTCDLAVVGGGFGGLWAALLAKEANPGRSVMRTSYDQRPATFARLAEHFFTTFPQLEGIGFSHRWGGAIDTCSRFCAFYGISFDS